MESSTRQNIYNLIALILEKEITDEVLANLLADQPLLESIGEATANYLQSSDQSKLLDELNIDFSSLFLLYLPPIEAFVRDNSKEIPVGLENPVMIFYRKHGFHINMNSTHINSPDHLAIELGFMVALIKDGNIEAQKEFLQTHLIKWSPSYLLAQSRAAETPFYRDFCQFAAEFLLADLDYLGSL